MRQVCIILFRIILLQLVVVPLNYNFYLRIILIMRQYFIETKNILQLRQTYDLEIKIIFIIELGLGKNKINVCNNKFPNVSL